ncbi:MAG: hypothetical protein PGN11_19700 [Quadrisphaera sp.]
MTRAVVDLVPVTRMRGGAVFFAAADAAAVLHAWRRWAPTLPREAATSAALLSLPPSPQLPPPLSGKQVVSVRFSHTGDPAAADALVAPVRSWAPVLVDSVQELPFTASDAVHTDPTDPSPHRERRHRSARAAGRRPSTPSWQPPGPGSGSPLVAVELRLMGGCAVAGAQDPRRRGRSRCRLLPVGGWASSLARRLPRRSRPWTGWSPPWAGGACPGPLNLGRWRLARRPAHPRAAHAPREGAPPGSTRRVSSADAHLAERP